MKALRVALLASMLTTLARVATAQTSEATDRPVLPPNELTKGPAPTFRHRALAGFTYGGFGGSTKLNGESAPAESGYGGSGGVIYSLELGLEERFTRLFSLAARVRFASANSDWAESIGYERTRWDFGLEPRLWIRPTVRKPDKSNFVARRVEGYAGVGSGVTLASESPPPRRAYDERIDGSPGYYISACIGATYGNERVAMFTELGYAFHSTHFEATLEPRAPGVPLTVEERDYVDHSILFSMGIVFGFGKLE